MLKGTIMTVEETTFKMTECANELHSHGDYHEAVLLLQMIDRLCDHYTLDMPDEAVSLNADLDEMFQTNVLQLEVHLQERLWNKSKKEDENEN